MNEDHFLRALEKDNIEEAESILESIKRKIPRTRFLYYEGMVLDGIGEPEEALKKFNMALVLHLSDPSIWLAKARVLQELGKMDMAKRSVDRACRLSSENPSACLLYADILYKMKDHRGAMVQIDNAMEMASDDPEILTLKGILVSIVDEDYMEALKYFDRAIDSDEDHASAWTNRGVALRMIGDKDGAIFSFQKALILDPDEKVAREMLEHIGVDDLLIPKAKKDTKKRKNSRRTRLMIDEAPKERRSSRERFTEEIDHDEVEEEDEDDEEVEEPLEDEEDLEDIDELDDEWEDEEEEKQKKSKPEPHETEIDDWDDIEDDEDELEELEDEEDPEPILTPPPPKKTKKKKKKTSKTIHLNCPRCSEQFDIDVKGKTKFSCPSCGLSGEID